MSFTLKIKCLNKSHKKENFYCNLCSYPNLTGEDFESSKKYGCCNQCYMEFIEGNREAWKNGWRPEKTIVNDYILLKKKINSKEIKWD